MIMDPELHSRNKVIPFTSTFTSLHKVNGGFFINKFNDLISSIIFFDSLPQR